MKILFLSDDFPPQSFGGAGIVAYNLAKGIQSKGHEVFVITTVRSKPEEGKTKLDGLTVFRIYTNHHERWRAWIGMYNPQTVSKVRKIIQETKPDIVHAHNIHSYLSYPCLGVAKKYSKAVFLTAHDVMLIHYGKLMPKNGNVFYRVNIIDQIKEAEKRYNPFRNIIIRHYLKSVDKIFAVSNAVKKILEINGIKNIETVYNGIDADEWKVKLEVIEKFKKEYDLQNKKIILFSGRLSKAKGGEVALKIIKKISESVKDVILLIAGRKDFYTEKMKKIINKNNISDKVIFTGWLNSNNMKIAVSSSDVCIAPSIYLDPFPTVNLEAMAAKKPVIGTYFGGTPEIVVNGKTGYIVDPHNTEDMMQKITDLLKNSQKAKQFGEAGHERVKELFSVERQVEQVLKWYIK